mgnify:CR=1 FL=1
MNYAGWSAEALAADRRIACEQAGGAASAGGGYNFIGKLMGGLALGTAAATGGGMLRGSLGRRAAVKSRDAEKEIGRLSGIASNPKLDEFTRKQADSKMR